jgi:hypothetical protein
MDSVNLPRLNENKSGLDNLNELSGSVILGSEKAIQEIGERDNMPDLKNRLRNLQRQRESI